MKPRHFRIIETPEGNFFIEEYVIQKIYIPGFLWGKYKVIQIWSKIDILGRGIPHSSRRGMRPYAPVVFLNLIKARAFIWRIKRGNIIHELNPEE